MKTKEELATYRREWNKNNKEKKSKAAKQYYEKNKEKIKEHTKKYRKNNREKILIGDRKRGKVYYETNKDRLLSKLRQNYKENPEFFKNKYYVQTYKITLEEYDKIFDSQCGKCAICGKHQSQSHRNFDVDHDHTTNKIRGLLCNNCNQGLGKFQDNADYLKNAINYLSRTSV